MKIDYQNNFGENWKLSRLHAKLVENRLGKMNPLSTLDKEVNKFCEKDSLQKQRKKHWPF